MEKTVSAVLVAAGSSTRMGFDKLSFDLGGETVLHRSIRAFALEEERIIRKLKKEKKEMKANGKLEKWEEGRTWKY